MVNSTDTIRASAAKAAQHGIVIDWSTNYELVTIGNVAMIEGLEALALIEKAAWLHSRTGATTMPQCMVHVCKSYIDAMEV